MTVSVKSRLWVLCCFAMVAAIAAQAHAADAPAPAVAAATQISIKPAAVDKKREAGIVGQYFKNVKELKEFQPPAAEPFLVRVDKNVNFKSVNGEFHKSKLSTDFAVAWTGYLRIKDPGEYTLAIKSDDGSTVTLGGTLLIDNRKMEVMKDKEAALTLAAGDYSIQIVYQQIKGGAGCQLSWKKPTDKDGKLHAISEANFFHDPAQEKVAWDKSAWDKAKWSRKAWAKEFGENFDKMDYGPFFSATIAVNEPAGNVANKGIAINVGKDDLATICFDADLMRWAGGWTGGFLDNHGVVFDGQHGVNPGPDGELMFEAPVLPGAIVGDDTAKLSKDPRPHPYGILPHEWAKYRGLYLNGDRVTIHYTVGDVDVLDTPWAHESEPGHVVTTRTIRLSASDKPLTMLLSKDDPQKPIGLTTSEGVQTKIVGENRYLVFPPRTAPTDYSIAIEAKQEKQDTAWRTARESIDDLIKPGAVRWGKPIEVKGEVATSTTQPYVVDTITAPEDNPYHSWLRFGGMDFFSDGRAAITTWSGDVWLVSGIDAKLDHVKWQRFATGLFQPLGLKIVKDEVYVLGRDQITRLKDSNNDGEADYYECFNNDCQVTPSFHEFAFDLQTDPEGNFYFSKAGPVRPGGRGWQVISDDNGAILRVSKDGSKFEVFASGLRAPNGMCVGPKGQVTVADNEGTWTPACRLSFVKQGAFLGVVDLSHTDPPPKTYDPPICWLPHGDVDNSSGGQVWVDSQNKWGPFEERLLHTSYGKCALFLVMNEEVDGVAQGGVVQFPKLDFLSGICRPRFNPTDHQFYVTGLRGWQTTAAKDCSFQRVRYTGAEVKMPTQLHVKPEGVAITFTSPLDPVAAADVNNYAVEQWNLLWSSNYGSDEYSVAEPKTKAHDPVDVEKVTLSDDHKTVFLKLEEVVPVMQMKIQMKLKAADGSPLNYSIYNTINRVPKTDGKPAAKTAAATH